MNRICLPFGLFDFPVETLRVQVKISPVNSVVIRMNTYFRTINSPFLAGSGPPTIKNETQPVAAFS